MYNNLPTSVGRLFWDTDPKKLDISRHRHTIVERVLNHGTLADWHWLVSAYGAETIREAVSFQSPVRANSIRKESARLVEMLIK